MTELLLQLERKRKAEISAQCVTILEKLETKWQKYEEEIKCLTHNLCMREMMVLNAACMSAVVHVHTTGRP